MISITESLCYWKSIYFKKRFLVIGIFGFSSGVPLFLTSSTLALWLYETGMSKTSIGFLGVVAFPYSIKFLWAPLLDHLPLPYLTRVLGRRRGWLILSQAILMFGLATFGFFDPSIHINLTIAMALIVSFAAATQETLVLAYQMESLDRIQYGPGEAIGILGYRIGMLVSGAGALYLATILTWNTVYIIMAACISFGCITVLCIREPRHPVSSSFSQASQKSKEQPVKFNNLNKKLGNILAWLRKAMINPFTDFTEQRGWFACILLMLLYKLGDNVIGSMSNIFYADLGFSKIEIANASKLFGMAALLFGGLIGGGIVMKYGFLRSLLFGTIIHGLANLMYVVLAHAGHDTLMLYSSIALENITSGMRTTAFIAYQMTLCNPKYAATQLALMTSLVSFGRTSISPLSGWLAETLNWVDFFFIGVLATIPGILIVLYLMRLKGVRWGMDKLALQS